MTPMEKMVRGFATHIPYNLELGIEIVDLGRGTAVMRLPWHPRLVGNPDSQVLHGGCITSLLDGASGCAVFMSLDEPEWFATLDLRIDYMKPAESGRDVFAKAHCYKMTKTIAFVRATAYHDTPDDPVATASGTFMRHKMGGVSL